MSCLTINDLPIAGGNTTVTISRGDAWKIWYTWFGKIVAEGRPHSVLRELSVWEIDGQAVKPTAWFLEF